MVKDVIFSVALVCSSVRPFVCLSLSVCMLVCEQQYSISYKLIVIKYDGGVQGGTIIKN